VPTLNQRLESFLAESRAEILPRPRLFPGKWFPGTTFQTFLCLLAFRKVGQRKTLSSQRKIWLGFQKSVFLLFWAENTFRKL